MKDDYFLYKSYLELIITSDKILPDVITKELKINPDRSFKKGEKYAIRYSTKTGERHQNLWAIRSSTLVTEKENLYTHITYFKSFLAGKEKIIQKFKDDPLIDVTLWIWIETDDGVGIEFSEKEMIYLSSISNKVYFSIKANIDIRRDK